MARERDVQDKQVRNLAKYKLSDDQQEQLHKLINTSHTSINSYMNSLAVWDFSFHFSPKNMGIFLAIQEKRDMIWQYQGNCVILRSGNHIKIISLCQKLVHFTEY